MEGHDTDPSTCSGRATSGKVSDLACAVFKVCASTAYTSTDPLRVVGGRTGWPMLHGPYAGSVYVRRGYVLVELWEVE